MESPQAKPLVPATPLSAGVAGTFATALIAALGFVGNEMLTLEKAVTQAIERGEARQDRFSSEITDIRGDVSSLRERMVILERDISNCTPGEKF